VPGKPTGVELPRSGKNCRVPHAGLRKSVECSTRPTLFQLRLVKHSTLQKIHAGASGANFKATPFMQ